MESVAEYLQSILALTLLCTAAGGLVQNSAAKGLFRLLSGMVLTIAIAAPLWRIDIDLPSLPAQQLWDRVNDAVAAGEEASSDALRQVIKQRTQAYIQDKARELNASVSVEIFLREGDQPVPQRAVLSGTVTPGVKRRLQEILETDLAITKENQEWTG